MSLEAVTAEEVEYVRKQLGTTEQDIRQAVLSLRNWLNQQPHLPKEIDIDVLTVLVLEYVDDQRLERMFINCKCSMERVKTSLDAYFSLKNKFPELLMNRDPEDPDLKKAKDLVKTFSMPRLTPDGLRVSYTMDVTPDPQRFDPLLSYKLILMWIEVLLAEDYSLGDITILDVKDFTASHVLKTSFSLVRSVEIIFKDTVRFRQEVVLRIQPDNAPFAPFLGAGSAPGAVGTPGAMVLLQKGARACVPPPLEAYCRRVKAVHLVNAPKVIDAILNIAKAALSEKLKKRVVTHLPGSQTLFDYIPRELVPDELGGSGGPVEKLYDAAWRKVSSYRAFFLDQDRHVTDESRRPPGSRNVSDLYGVEGSFRKLAID